MTVKKTLIKINGSFIPNPASLTWGLQDISDPNAGRDINGTMHPNKITQKRKLQLEWKAVSFATAAEVLQAVNHKTFDVTYMDAMENRPLTKTFYVGDRSAPVYSYAIGQQWYSNITFDLIEV